MKGKFIVSIIALLFLHACTTEKIPTETPTKLPIETPTNTISPTITDTPTQTITPTTGTATPELPGYSFNLAQEVVDVIWNEDGTLSLEYEFIFTNSANGSPIDFVDVDIPSQNYDLSNISAEVDGNQITHIALSTFVSGAVELGLEQNTILPGETGIVSVRINQIHGVLFSESSGNQEVNAVFSPTWFSPDFSHGTTDMTVVFHLPPGVEQEEIGSHTSPPSWTEEPIFGMDQQGLTTLTWSNPVAEGYTQYLFGVLFPASDIPEAEIMMPGQIEPRVAQAFHFRAFSYAEKNRLEAAVDDLNWSIKIDPNNPYAFLLRGMVYAEIGDLETARVDIETALSLGLDSEAAQYAQSLLEELLP